MSKKSIYLDYNATSPIGEEVRIAIDPYLNESFGNPSSIYAAGRTARHGLEKARLQVASLINADPENIFFTSGGTESNNTALFGAARFAAKKKKGNHIVTSTIEHSAVLSPCRVLKEQEGFEVTYVPVDRQGRVDPDDVLKAVRDETVLVSLMTANNEVGTLQPVEEVGRKLREKKIPFHTDAVQALAHIKLDMKKMPVDMLSLSGHKIGALKGIGILYVRPGVKLLPLIVGGEQEMTLRSGTENIVGAVSFGAAAERVAQKRDKNVPLFRKHRDTLWEGIRSKIEGAHLNGHPELRLPNTLSIGFEGVEGEALLLALDMEGIAASSGSACASGSVETSHVLQAMGLPEDLAKNTVRFSIGEGNTEEDVETVLSILPQVISRIRSANVSR